MNKIYDSKINNVHYNIAFERQLSQNTNDDVSLFLWQNSPAVVIGRNQNPLVECNLEYLKEHNILLARRFSGGGAVFHDLGNINYTLVMKADKYDLEVAKQFLFKAFEHLKLEVEFSGRNDMTINGAKFSGQAYFAHKDMYVLHGTLLLNADMTRLSKCLTPSKLKLESKGIKSVKSRVINLSEVDSSLTMDKLREALYKGFEDVYGQSMPVEDVTIDNIDKELSSFISSDEWIYSKTPKYQIEIEKRFPFGIIKLNLNLKNNQITTAKIYTDSLLTDWKDAEEELIGLEFDENKIWEAIAKLR